MSITTYTELVAALDGADGYLHRTNLTAKIPDFIRLAESRMNRRLKLLLQETETTLTAVVGSRSGATMAVPSLFSQPIALWQTTYLPRTELYYMTAEALPVTTSNGASTFFTVDGAYIATENPADQAYTYLLRYLTGFNIASTSTNTVLTNYPDVYVYGALAESVPYTGNVDMQQMWEAKFDAGIREAISDTTATKGRMTLRTDRAVQRPRIIRGY